MASRSQNARQAETRAHNWNTKNPIGTEVTITHHDGSQTTGQTTSAARVVPNYGLRRVVVDVNHQPMALSQVDVLQAVVA